ncbi:prepilin peptidase [Ramlibacter humi]|uniref:Prepilin leader peptidase/N-methyltransferase n=1 Tax=Ramlibacter humi TaxID=2530451 RepID=A0A4Z0BYY5_9BURK|nr:A24 family peptidase [Ramlibacter humi]TFZ04181.1 prepilin peptidase [Ramlibacter humi]
MMLPQALAAAVAGVLGLLVGSFLNVVIHRVPAMLHRGWLAESLDNLQPVPPAYGRGLWQWVFGDKAELPKDLEASCASALKKVEALAPLGIATPRSRCPHCGAAIRWYQNIPVLSYLALRGRCANCKAAISPRYPIVELVTAGLFALCGHRFGLSLQAAFWAFFCAILVCQFLIDLDTQLLPDDLNYLLLWGGLAGAALKVTGVPLTSAVWGAIFGYLSLWLVYHGYRLATGKHGMGHGDFKLLAALGAWLGATYLLPVILLSAVVGAVLGATMLIVGRLADRNIPIAFGPFLAGAGLVAFLLGPLRFQEAFSFAFPF